MGRGRCSVTNTQQYKVTAAAAQKSRRTANALLASSPPLQ